MYSERISIQLWFMIAVCMEWVQKVHVCVFIAQDHTFQKNIISAKVVHMFLFTPEKKVRETQRHTQKDKIYQPKNGKSQNATKNRYVAYTHSPWLQFQKVPRSLHFPSSTLMSNSIAWSKWKKKLSIFFNVWSSLRLRYYNSSYSMVT